METIKSPNPLLKDTDLNAVKNGDTRTLPEGFSLIGGVIHAVNGAVAHIIGVDDIRLNKDELVDMVSEKLTKASAGLIDTATGMADAMGTKGLQMVQSKLLNALVDSKPDLVNGVFPELSQPDIVITTPDSYNVTSGTSAHMSSGQHIALSSTQHTSIAAGRRVVVSALHGTRMFAQHGGMKYTAAAGKIDIQAQTDAIGMLAQKDIEITSENGEIVIRSKKRIRIESEVEVVVNGGTSYSNWKSNGITHGTNGVWMEHAGAHDQSGPDSKPTVMPHVEKEKPKYSNKLDVLATFNDTGAHHEVPYKVILPNGNIEEGVLDKFGRTARIGSDTADAVKVIVGEHGWDTAINFYPPNYSDPR